MESRDTEGTRQSLFHNTHTSLHKYFEEAVGYRQDCQFHFLSVLVSRLVFKPGVQLP